MSAQAQSFCTPDEYLERERAAFHKSEYYAGEIFAMGGASLAHSLLVAGMIAALGARLHGTPCATFASDLRIECGPFGLFCYPDVSVLCGSPQYRDAHRDVVTNPTLVVEVLSQSTEGYGRGAKFAHYRRLSSLREYVLVSQDEARMEVFTRGDAGYWTLTEAVGQEAACPLACLDIALPLSEVCERVEFPRAGSITEEAVPGQSAG